MGRQVGGRRWNITCGLWGISEPASALKYLFISRNLKGATSLGRECWDHFQMQHEKMGRIQQLSPKSGPESAPSDPLLLCEAPGTLTISFFCRSRGRIPETGYRSAL